MSGRTLRLGLAASLALNVFVLGAAAGGAAMWFSRDDAAPAASAQRGLRFAAQELAPAERRAFRQTIAESRKHTAADAARARELRARIAASLAAEPMDASALASTLAEIRDSDMRVRAGLEDAIVGFAAKLSPADRVRFVEGLRGRAGMMRGAGATTPQDSGG